MKNLKKVLMMTTLMALSTINVQAHNGGNGGEELELVLKKRSHQIGHFLKSTMGSTVFNTLNPDGVMDIINTMDINVTSNQVTDRHNIPRTCVNEPLRKIITCNAKKITSLINKREDILTAIIFHEILGLMGFELGHEENPSMYPISSRILPYYEVVMSTPLSEAQIRPEFLGLDLRSYGITFVNKKTKESVRMICLNDNVQVNRCRNFSVVRKANDMQAPLVADVQSLSPANLKNFNLKKVTYGEIKETESKLKALRSKGVEFLTLGGKCKIKYENSTNYLYGAGIGQRIAGECSYEGIALSWLAFFVPGAIDLTTEVAKQSINTVVYPIKALVYGIRKFRIKRKIKKFNKKIEMARKVLNLDNKLSLVGKTKKVSDSDFDQIVSILEQSISAQK